MWGYTTVSYIIVNKLRKSDTFLTHGVYCAELRLGLEPNK